MIKTDYLQTRRRRDNKELDNNSSSSNFHFFGSNNNNAGPVDTTKEWNFLGPVKLDGKLIQDVFAEPAKAETITGTWRFDTPFEMKHTNKVSNLNADLLDGLHASDLQPKESTAFQLHTNYVAVRTPSRAASQYYEFWDSGKGWAGIKSGSLEVVGTAELIKLIDKAKTGNEHANYISFYDTVKRHGWIGFGSRSNDKLHVLNEAGDVALSAGNKERLTVLANGNVGIGTPDPKAKFNIIGSGHVSQVIGSTASGNSQLILDASNGDSIGTDYFMIAHVRAKNILGIGYGSPDKLTLKPSGELGIGTSSPTEKLDVRGLINSQTVHGYFKIGVMNSGWAHMLTDRPSFYMSTKLTTNGNVEPYDNKKHFLGSSSRHWKGAYIDDLKTNTISPNSILNVKGLIYSQTEHGFFTVGSQNTGWAHMLTDRPSFYMSTKLTTDGNVEPYTHNKFSLGSSSRHWKDAYVDSLNAKTINLSNLPASSTDLQPGDIYTSLDGTLKIKR